MRLLDLLGLAALAAPVLGAQETRGTAVVTGVVLDSLHRPIESAEVAIAALRMSVRTDTAGRFTISRIEPGVHVVSARRVGYEPGELRVMLRAGETMDIDFVLRTATAQLEEVRVHAEVLIPSFEEHRSRGLGSFLTRADLEKNEHRRVPEVLRQLRSANVHVGRGHAAWMQSTRSSQSRSIMGFTRNARDGADRVDGATQGACYAQVYLDNQIVYRGEPGEPLFNLNTLQVHQIEAIEWYAGPSQTPLRYSGLNATCGVLVIHTRRSLAPMTSQPNAERRP